MLLRSRRALDDDLYDHAALLVAAASKELERPCALGERHAVGDEARDVGSLALGHAVGVTVGVAVCMWG